MSQEKIHPVNADIVGRVLSLEQRVKGLSGRIAAIEARLSYSGDRPAGNVSPAEDFVQATGQYDHPPAIGCGISGDKNASSGKTLEDAGSSIIPGVRRGLDMTGLIAGAILIGAGLLLLSGNIDIIKNPLVAMGCGILLIASGTHRKTYK